MPSINQNRLTDVNGTGPRDHLDSRVDTRLPFPRGATSRPWLEGYPEGVPGFLKYPERPLDWLLEMAATRFPHRTAFHYYSESLTYEELEGRAIQLARLLLREGLKPGERVGVLLPNLPESIVSLFAIWMAGGVVVSLSPLMVADEVASLLKKTDCRMVITLDVLSPLVCHGDHPLDLVIVSSLQGRISRLEQLGYAWVRFQRIGLGNACPSFRTLDFETAIASVPRFASPLERKGFNIHSPALILPTGGTTGNPKAVTLTHRGLMAQAWQLSHWSGEPAGEHSMLAVLPFFHSYGLSTSLMMGTALGATLILHHRFRPSSAVKLIEQHRPTMFMAVPAMLAAMNTKILSKRHHDLSSLQYIISGGAPLPLSVAEEFNVHADAIVVEGYGLSEASPVTHVGPLDGSARSGSIGFPLPDTDAKIVDQQTMSRELKAGMVGELAVRGPQLMAGYWNDPEATAQVMRDGWLLTGDLARRDENGFFEIVDRKKDLIITSGFNVYPGDVEAVLREFPGIADVAVIGVSDDIKGELVKAVVVMEPGQPFNEWEFNDFARENLSAHKRPRLVETRIDLPKNFLGKILRRELRTAEKSNNDLEVNTH